MHEEKGLETQDSTTLCGICNIIASTCTCTSQQIRLREKKDIPAEIDTPELSCHLLDRTSYQSGTAQVQLSRHGPVGSATVHQHVPAACIARCAVYDSNSMGPSDSHLVCSTSRRTRNAMHIAMQCSAVTATVQCNHSTGSFGSVFGLKSGMRRAQYGLLVQHMLQHMPVNCTRRPLRSRSARDDAAASRCIPFPLALVVPALPRCPCPVPSLAYRRARAWGHSGPWLVGSAHTFCWSNAGQQPNSREPTPPAPPSCEPSKSKQDTSSDWQAQTLDSSVISWGPWPQKLVRVVGNT